MHIVEKINACAEEMTRSERQVAAYFTGHLNDFAFYTLDRLAAEIGTSTTSVIRFCRRLDFPGYKAFQAALRDEVRYQPELPVKLQRTMDSTMGDELLAQTVQQEIRCIQQTFHAIPEQTLRDAVQLLAEAKRVFTLGMRESFALAHYAFTRLITVRSSVSMLSAGYNGEIEPLLGLGPEDVCVVFLFHRYTRQMLQMLPMLKKQGVRVILVTSRPCDKVEEFAAVLLPCRVDAGGIKNTAIAPICLVDYLCNAVAVRNGDACLHYMQQMEELFKISSVLGG